MAVVEAQLQRQKAEKKQLKAYAIQLKEKLETLEVSSSLWMKNKDTLTNLINEIRPLHLELSEQIEIISSLKGRYIQLLTSLGQSPVGGGTTMDSTDILLFEANNSVQTAAMLCDCAVMKGFVTPSPATATATREEEGQGFATASSASALVAGRGTPSSSSGLSSPVPPSSPIKIQIRAEELDEIVAATGGSQAQQQRESEESEEEEEESPIINAVKSSLWEFGATMLEVESSIDKLLR
jgi:hypothetical protein